MMQRIECMNCGDIVELTGDSVTLPFVCKECTEAKEFQEKISPTLKDFSENPTLVSALEKAGYRLVPLDQQLADFVPEGPVQMDGPVPPAEEEHSGATVENTTLLIEDLEKQLSDTMDELGRSNLLIVDLKEENNDLKEVVSNLVRANLQLYAERNDARGRVLLLNQRRRELFREAMFYSTQGFFGRLFGRKYQG